MKEGFGVWDLRDAGARAFLVHAAEQALGDASQQILLLQLIFVQHM